MKLKMRCNEMSALAAKSKVKILKIMGSEKFVILLEGMKFLFSLSVLIVVYLQSEKVEILVEKEKLFFFFMGMVFFFMVFCVFFKLKSFVMILYRIVVGPFLGGLLYFSSNPWKGSLETPVLIMKRVYSVEELQWAMHCRFNGATDIYPDFALQYKWSKAIELTGGSIEALEAKVYKDLLIYGYSQMENAELFVIEAGKYIFPTLQGTWWLLCLGYCVQVVGLLWLGYNLIGAGKLSVALSMHSENLNPEMKQAVFEKIFEYGRVADIWSSGVIVVTSTMLGIYLEADQDQGRFLKLVEDRFYPRGEGVEYEYSEKLAPCLERDEKGFIKDRGRIRLRDLSGWPTRVPGSWEDPIEGRPELKVAQSAYFPKPSEWKGPWE